MATTIGFVGEELNLLVRQGADFLLKFKMSTAEGVPINLTGCVIRGQVRKNATATSLTVALTTPVTAPLTGEYELSLTAAQTSAIKAVDDPKSGDNVYVWDLEFVDSLGKVKPLYYGKLTIFREVTRV